ncbi:hypothetical protein FSPOR_11352 [Fusarium sporotrichioides]|uniref:Carbohydrate-binding module family 19 domain-containing protein n=1 Tax=Fusarium sporotrichioides TaxID=5514 RepID=A0A395RH38_FUSSP|nr:hypothetical protein FSPOR_11352 [Fusarium sporotrichioides]
MRYNRMRLAVAMSLLLTVQSAQAGPMWTGREKRNPGVFLEVRMENSQVPTAAHDGYGYEPAMMPEDEERYLTIYARSGNGDQTTPRPIFETLNSTPDPNPLFSENPGDEKKKGPYSDLPEPVEVIPVQPTNEAPQPTSEAQEPTQEEPVNKPTFTQNTSAPVITTSIVPKDPDTEVEKPTSDQPQYQSPEESAVVTETAPISKEIPTSVNQAPTYEPAREPTTSAPEVPTTQVTQQPENSETKGLDSTVDLGTLQPSEGENTKPSAIQETAAPEAPSSPATTSIDEQPMTTPVEDVTTAFAYEPTPSGYLTTQAPGDTAFPINPKHPSNIYPNPPTTPAGNVPETSAAETKPAVTTETVSVVQPKNPQLETTSDVQDQPAPTTEAAQPEGEIPVSEPVKPSSPAPTSEVKQIYPPAETPDGQKPDTPAEPSPIETSAPIEPQNPVPTPEPAQPNVPTKPTVQQPEAPAETSALQQPAPAPSDAEPQYPAPGSDTMPAAPAGPPTTTAIISNPSSPETTSVAKVVPTGSPADGVPTINTEVPTGTSAIPAPAYASNVVDARTYNEEFAKLTPESACMKGQAACITGQMALCGDDGAFELLPCETQGEKCFALPLYNVEGGIKIVCEDPATAAKILGGTPGGGEENTAPGNENQDQQPVPTSTVEKQPEVPVVTVTTIVTVDDGAVPEPTSEPAQEQPVQPTQPVNEQPSQPNYQQPTQAQPAPEETTQPATEQPSQPDAGQPARPTSPSQPSQPEPEQPSQPAQTQPVQEQPSQPNEEKPTQTNPQEPSSPQPTKAYEDLPPTSPPVAEPSTNSMNFPGGTTLTKSIKKPDEAKPTASPGDDDGDDDDKPTSVELIPIPDKPTKAPAPAATEANADSQDDKKPTAVTRTGDEAHATTIVVDGTPTVSVYFTVTVTDKDQATVTVTEKEKETVTLVISA